jgi:hypothetical protein
MSRGKVFISPVAKSIPFDNSSNGFVSSDTQGAIEEINNSVATSASPGFTWGRSGTTNGGTYLQNESVPSNTSGRTVFLNNAVIKKVFIANQDATVLIIEVMSHDGDGLGMTLLGTVTTTAQRTSFFDVNFAVAINKQLAVRLKNTSNAAKNIVVGVLIKGDI